MHEMFVTDNLLAITVASFLMFIDTLTSVDRHQNRKIKTGIGIRFVKDSHRVGV